MMKLLNLILIIILLSVVESNQYGSSLFIPADINVQEGVPFQIGSWMCHKTFSKDIPEGKTERKPYYPPKLITEKMTAVYAYFTLDPGSNQHKLDYIGKSDGNLYNRAVKHQGVKRDPYYQRAQATSFFCYLPVDEVIWVNDKQVECPGLAPRIETGLLDVFYSPGNIVGGILPVESVVYMTDPTTGLRTVPVDYLYTVEFYYQDVLRTIREKREDAGPLPKIGTVFNRNQKSEPILAAVGPTTPPPTSPSPPPPAVPIAVNSTSAPTKVVEEKKPPPPKETKKTATKADDDNTIKKISQIAGFTAGGIVANAVAVIAGTQLYEAYESGDLSLGVARSYLNQVANRTPPRYIKLKPL